MAFAFSAKNQILNSSLNPVVSTVNIATTVELIVICIHTSTGTTRSGGTPTQAGTDYKLIGSVTTKGGLCQTELWYIMNDDVTTGVATNQFSVPNSGTDVITVDAVRFSVASGKEVEFEDGTNSSGNSATPSNTTTGLTSGVDKLSVSGMTSEYNKTGPGFTGSDTTTFGPTSFDSASKITWSMYDINSTFATTNVMSHSIATDVWHMVQGSFKEVTPTNLVSCDGVLRANIVSRDGVTLANIIDIDGITN